MGYRSEVAFALPASEWRLVKSNAQVMILEECPQGRTCFLDHPDEELKFERDGAEWVLVRWDWLKWYSDFEEVRAVEQYFESDKPFEFIRIGEEDEDIEVRSSNGYMECIQTRTIIDIQV